MLVNINGRNVCVYGISIGKALESNIFQDWIDNLDPNFRVTSIEIQSVDFGGNGRKPFVRFIKFKANVVDKEGNILPGIVFMRGGSVAILVILECEGVDYTVLTLQPRFPVGKYSLPEIPAGTLEGDTFVGGAARELEEETGIKISTEDLVDLTQIVYGDRFQGVFPSPGGTDEFIRLFAFRKTVTPVELAEINGKATGLANENEKITLKIVPLRNLIYETSDAKALSAFVLYEEVKNMRKI